VSTTPAWGMEPTTSSLGALPTHHLQDTTNNQTLFKNITHNKTLETCWRQQDEDSQEFIRSLQQMKNKINKIRVNRMVQTDICSFFNRS
jgi:hypothetical protein